MVYSDWLYRKSHLITSSDTSTNYQVKIRVYYTNGTDNGQTVYLNTHCNIDFSDVRFTNSSLSPLSHWIETSVASSYADFWIKLDTLSTSNTIYIYYGNENASSESNGYNTFTEFDDFSSNTIGTKWTEVLTYGGATRYLPTHTIENGGYHLYTGSAYDAGGGLQLINALSGNVIATVTLELINWSGRSPPYGYFGIGWITSPIWEFGWWGTTIGGFYPNYTTDTLTLVWYSTGAQQIYRSGTLVASNTISAATTLTPSFGLRTGGSEIINAYFKNFYVHKYIVGASIVHSAWGTEEYIGSNVIASFSYLISNNFVTFTNTSVSPTYISSMLWDFGDDTIDDSSIVTHEYFAPATYDVSLYVKNSLNFASYITKSITIVNQSIFWPQAVSILDEQWPTFEPCEVKLQCISQPSKYTENTSYLWNFGDGSTSILQDPMHIFNSSGSKTITLTVSNIYGSISTTKTIDVSANVKVYFSPMYKEGSPSFDATFYDVSIPQSEVLTRTWDFGDDSTSTETSPTHTYSIIGGYSPSLTITYHGGSKTLTHPNSILVGLETKHLSDTFSYSESYEPLEVRSFSEIISFATFCVPVFEILTDKLSYIQREVPSIRGILETGKRFAFHISELGKKVYTKFDEFGRKILKQPTYTDKTGFYTCEEIREVTDIIQFEDSATSFATS